LTTTPCAASCCYITCLTSALQPPQPVAALVHCFIAPMSVAPALTAWQISALLTLWQEQICALSGSAATPRAFGALAEGAGKISASGLAGSALPFRNLCTNAAWVPAAPPRPHPNHASPPALPTLLL